MNQVRERVEEQARRLPGDIGGDDRGIALGDARRAPVIAADFARPATDLLLHSFNSVADFPWCFPFLKPSRFCRRSGTRTPARKNTAPGARGLEEWKKVKPCRVEIMLM